MDSKQEDAARSNDRFAGQTAKVEDVLKAQTVGLVKLDEFRKRRVEALESGQSTPATSDRYVALVKSKYASPAAYGQSTGLLHHNQVRRRRKLL
jgi:hypothetical protein